MRRRGIDTIVLGGVATHIGVDTTARDAYQLNYNQYFCYRYDERSKRNATSIPNRLCIPIDGTNHNHKRLAKHIELNIHFPFDYIEGVSLFTMY